MKMTFEAKERIVVLFLVVLTAWPPVQHLLIRMTDLSPWKFAAWSMYCVPSRSIRIAVISLEDGGQLPLDTLMEQGAYLEFINHRKALGRWAEPDGLARATFDLFPEVEGIEIIVEQAGVDRATAMLVAERLDQYEYHRDTRAPAAPTIPGGPPRRRP